MFNFQFSNLIRGTATLAVRAVFSDGNSELANRALVRSLPTRRRLITSTKVKHNVRQTNGGGS